MTMTRVMVFDRLDNYVCDLNPSAVVELRNIGEVNAEHSLTIALRGQTLEKTNRVVLRDAKGKWHEYVVLGIDGAHGEVTEYYCIWSLQYDLAATFINDQYGAGIVPGHASVPCPARTGLTVALSGTRRWQIGTVTVTTMAAASFYRRSGWEGMQTVTEVWGGELDATITVGLNKVESRAVDLLDHIGSKEATRRFDYGHDVARIRRIVSDDVWACRIVPLGKASETEAGGYTRRPSIESVNDGVMWLQNDDVVPFTRIPDGQGGWEYPTIIVVNDTYEDPADLLAWALEHIGEYTQPKVTYEADVIQLAMAGMNPHGVSLGDEVVVVDRTFWEDMYLSQINESGAIGAILNHGRSLVISARVIRQECNLLDPSDITLTIGNAREKLSGQLAHLSRQVEEVASQVSNASAYQASADYMANLLGRLNAEINALGGFVYITQGYGFRCYDVAVSDPLVGAEATQVVEIKGGTIRIADAKTSDGDWEWKTLIESGHLAAELVTALNVTAGFIRGINGTYIDLDSGTVLLGDADGFHLLADSTHLGFYQGNVCVAYVTNEMLYVPLAVGVNAIQVGEEGNPSWQWKLRPNGNLQLKYVGTED